MDKDWLLSLNPKSLAVVPTNSLANHVTERHAAMQLECGNAVWHSPNVVVWSTLLKELWLSNQPTGSASQILSSAQSDLLWTKIIEGSARDDQDLMLLNVPQTVRAVRASWQKLHDWCIEEATLETEFAVDHQQLLLWFNAYREVLSNRKFIDPAQLSSLLFDRQLTLDFDQLYWVSYDLVTQAQQRLSELFEQQGVKVTEVRPDAGAACIAKNVFDNERSELAAVLQSARKQLEIAPKQNIAVVIPDLQHKYRQVQELARDVFYPDWSPLMVRQQGAAYRFSLGQPLIDLAPITTALSLIEFFRGPIKVTDLKRVFRSHYLGDLSVAGGDSGRGKFELLEILAELRVHRLSLAKLKEVYEQYLNGTEESPARQDMLSFLEQALTLQGQIQQQLNDTKEANGFASLSFAEWLAAFEEWLALWGWGTAVDADQASSHEYQLQQRWNSVKEELIGLSLLQKTAGFARVIDLLKKQLRDAVFLPKANSTPIIISGTLEAIGRDVDTMFVTGMHEDFPKPAPLDAFIPNRILAQHHHPHASVEQDLEYQKKVIANLLACSSKYQLSYAKTSDKAADIERSASPLFDKEGWQPLECEPVVVANMCLESYQDVTGPALDQMENVRGGAKIFENQSNCAFRAFASHRLGLRLEQENEFGLDALDRGNIVHYLLETLWGEIKSQENLARLSEEQLNVLIDQHIERACFENVLKLAEEKQRLLLHETNRLRSLLKEWMQLELKRPTPFKVLARELKGQSVLAGVPYRYVIDRVDELEDGRHVVIDYKTGEVDRKDCSGERIKSPQLPLYALSISDLNSKQSLAGISFAKVKRWKCDYQELADDGIFRLSSRHTKARAEQWNQESARWHEQFESLARAFCDGDAQVNPIDQNTCKYCEFDALCRVEQLRGGSYDE